MKAAAIAFALILACASPTHAPSPIAPSSEGGLAEMMAHGGLVMAMEAKLQSDSAWQWSWTHRREAAMCIPKGAYAFGVALNGQPFVLVLGFIGANVQDADSVNVRWKGSICGDSLPSFHTHLIENGMRWRPSPCDMHGAAMRPRVPFHLMASDTGKVTAYMPDQNFASTAVNWCGQR